MLNVAYAPLTVHRAVVTHFAHHAKRNALVVGLLLLVRTRFQVLFHSPRRGSFRLSLTVLVHYRYSDRIPRVPPYSSSSQPVCFSVREYHPVPCDFPDASTNTQADSDSGLLPVRSPLLGESRLISFPRGT